MSPTAERLRVAWFSPLNVGGGWGPSKAAYFTDILLPLIRRQCEVDLFHNSFEQYQDYPTYHYLKAFELDKEDPYDIIFYNLEDAKWCNFVRSHLGLLPGITYFHDFILSNYGPEPLLNSPYDNIIKKFFKRNAAWPVRDEKNLRKGPHAFREAALSPVKVFATEHMLCEYRNVFRDSSLSDGDRELNAFYLPYPVLERENNSLKRPLKKIGFCGSPRIECRAHKLLGALLDLEEEFELVWLIDSSERGEAEQLLGEFNIKNVNLETGRSPHAWSEIISDVDIAVHTFFSVYGNPYPYLSISLKAGLPVIVSNFGSTEYLPSNLVFKIQSGDSESAEIKMALQKIMRGEVTFDPSRVSEYAREVYSAEGTAHDLLRIFGESADKLAKFRKDWKIYEDEARRSLIEESRGFLDGSPAPGCEPAKLFNEQIAPIFKELGWQ